MCPLDRANNDSVCARVPRSSEVSRSRHGSTGKALSPIIWPRSLDLEQLADVLYDDIRAVFAQSLRLPDAVDADDETETPGPPGGHTGEGILEDRAGLCVRTDLTGTLAEGVRRGFPGQMPFLGDYTVDDRVEKVGQLRALENVLGVGTRRDDCGAQSGLAHPTDVVHGVVVDLDAVLADLHEDQVVLAVGQAVHSGGSGRI